MCQESILGERGHGTLRAARLDLAMSQKSFDRFPCFQPLSDDRLLSLGWLPQCLSGRPGQWGQGLTLSSRTLCFSDPSTPGLTTAQHAWPRATWTWQPSLDCFERALIQGPTYSVLVRLIFPAHPNPWCQSSRHFWCVFHFPCVPFLSLWWKWDHSKGVC